MREKIPLFFKLLRRKSLTEANLLASKHNNIGGVCTKRVAGCLWIFSESLLMLFNLASAIRQKKVPQTVFASIVFLFGAMASHAQAQEFDWLVNIDDIVDGVDYDPTAAGQQVLTDIVVTNDGPDPAPATTHSFAFADDPDFSLASTSGSMTGCVTSTFTGGLAPAPFPAPFTAALPYDTGTIVTCDVPALGEGETANVLVAFDTNDAAVLNIVSQVPFDVGESNEINNRISETITIVRAADLEIDLSIPGVPVDGDGNTLLAAGEEFTFAVDISNLGPNDAQSYRVTVPIPGSLVNVAPVAGISADSCAVVGSNLVCDIAAELLTGAAAPTLLFDAQIGVADSSTIGISGVVDNSTPIDAVADNNTDIAIISVQAGTDASITKSRVDQDGVPLIEGDLVTFTLNTAYTGNAPTGITVTDDIPSNYEILSVSSTGGYSCTEPEPDGTFASQTVVCTNPGGGPAAADAPIGTITIEARVRDDGAAALVQNVATIVSTGPDEQNTDNNTARDEPTVIAEPTVDVAARKTGPTRGLAVVGNSYNYSIYAEVIGNRDLTGTVTLTDLLPAGITVNGISEDAGYVCTVDGAAPVFPIVVDDANAPVALVCVQTFDETDPLLVNVPFSEERRIIYNTTINRAGSIANTVAVGVGNGNLSGGTTDNDTTTYNVTADLAVDSANISVIKFAEGARDDAPTAIAGEPYTFQIQINNAGPQPSQNVRVLDVVNGLQDGNIAFDSVGYENTPAGSCVQDQEGDTSRRLNCTIASVPVCGGLTGVDCPIISYTMIPGGDAETRNNGVQAFSTVTPDPAGPTSRSDVDYPFERRADVTVSKRVPPTAAVGVDLTYLVEALNEDNNLSSAAGVFITDILPPDVTFISATLPNGDPCGTTPAPLAVSSGLTSNATNTVICTFPGLIANGASQVATIVVRPNFDNIFETITNNVRVDATTIETNPDNNTFSVDTEISAPAVDLIINKDDDVDPLPLGDEVLYTVTVTNAGPSASQDVVITDTWPDSIISFQGVRQLPAGGTCSTIPANDTFGEDIVCEVPYLEADQTVTLIFAGRGDARGAVTNNASVSSREIVGVPDPNDPSTILTFDEQDANNQISDLTTVRPRADVEVTSKTAVTTPASDPPVVNLREEFAFEVLVTVNSGPGLNEAEAVTFRDQLPPNMVLVGAPTFVVTTSGPADPLRACAGIAGETLVTCQFGTLQPDDTVLITIPVRVDAVSVDPQVITNTASVATDSLEDVPARLNNTNTGDITVASSSIAGNVFRDFADNEDRDLGDTNVSGVPITLTGVTFDGITIDPITVDTDADGNFLFDGLPEGTYTVSRGDVDEDYLEDGINTSGNIDGADQGSTVGGNAIVDIALPPASDSVENIFRVVPQARVGIAKDASVDSLNADGSVNVSFDLVVENFSIETLINVSVTDQLSGGDPRFGTFVSLANPLTDPLAPGQYTIIAAPGGDCGVQNAGYNGDLDQVLVTGGILDPGDVCNVTFGLRVTPTAAQLADGFENQATVTAEGDLSGQTSDGPDANPQLTDDSDDGVEPDADDNGQGNEPGENDPTPIPLAFESSIALIKVADLTAISTPFILDGDTITYRFTVRNTGNVTLTDITIEENLIGAVVSGTIPSLAPGEEDQTSITATYLVTQTNINEGQVINTATVTGTDPFDQPVTDDSGTTFDDDEPLITTPLAQVPGIALVKLADTSGIQDPTQVGDVIRYTFEVRNTGNVTLTNVFIEDTLDGLTLIGSPIATLLPGAVNSDAYSATYTIDFDDIEAGEIINRATVTGTDPNDDLISDDSGLTPETDEDTVVPLSRQPGIETTKTQEFVDDGDGRDGVGDTINYTITVRNIGNVPLSGVTVDDTLTNFDGAELDLTELPEFDSADQGSLEGTLLQGETATYFASYVLELPDVIAGGVSNTATSTGVGIDGDDGGPGTPRPVDDVSDDGDDTDGNTTDDPTEQPLAPNVDSTGLSMNKTTPNEVVSRGEVVPYTITVANESSFTAGPYNIVDRLPNGLIYIPGSATIDGAVAEVTFIAGRVTWSDVTIPALGEVVVTLEARVLNGARSGSLVNSVSLIDPVTGEAVLSDETATVRILPDTLFECTDVIGKVFNDVNGNGYQDAPDTVGRGVVSDQSFLGGKGKISPAAIEPRDELGIPGVRLATVDGTIITTDENGFYSVPCASLPASGGSNFIIKVDERSLPAGYRMTTENPRVSRLTPGMMAETNFGASVALQVVRVDLTTASFVQTADGIAMSAGLRDGLRGVLEQIAGSPSNMVLSFFVSASADADDVSSARALLDMVEDQVKRDWRDIGRVRLRIEQAIVRAGQ